MLPVGDDTGKPSFARARSTAVEQCPNLRCQALGDWSSMDLSATTGEEEGRCARSEEAAALKRLSCEKVPGEQDSPEFPEYSGEMGQKDKTEVDESGTEDESEAGVDEVSSVVDADEEESAERRRQLIGEGGESGEDSEEDSETQSDAGVLKVPEETEDC